jgi:hypothetical protein
MRWPPEVKIDSDPLAASDTMRFRAAIAVVFALAALGQPTSAAGICPTTVTLSQNASTTVVAGNGVSCNGGPPGLVHFDNSYFRAFDLSAFPTGFTACRVDVGIEAANAGDPATSQPITVNLYSNSGLPFPGGTRVAVGTATVQVSDRALSTVGVPLEALVPAGTQLVAEVFTPNGTASGHSFLMGSNPSPEAAPSYIQAQDCGLPTPISFASAGSANTHLVLTVIGAPTGPTQTLAPDQVAFGSIAVGATSAPRSIAIGNAGPGVLIVTSISPPSPPFAIGGTDTCTGAAIAVGMHCVIDYTFSPSTAGTFSQTLTVASNATSGTGDLRLDGTGVQAPPVPTLGRPAALVLALVLISLVAWSAYSATAPASPRRRSRAGARSRRPSAAAR